MNDIKCVITGGAGFIGSHIAQTLIENGVGQVTILDNMTKGKIENLKELDHDKINMVCADITDADLNLIFEDHDYVFHEAALTSVPESIQKPTEVNKINIDGTFRVLKAACECNIKKVISASSAAVAGHAAGG